MPGVTTPISGILRSVSLVTSNGGSVLTTGIIGTIIVPFSGIISSVSLLADETGNVVMDIWKTQFSSYPPTNTNTITASDLPTLSSAQSYQDTTLTGWTTQINPNDVLAFNINSVTNIKQLTVALGITAQ